MKPPGPVFDKVWRDGCSVIRVDRHHVARMIRKHYIGKWPGVVVLILALKRGHELLGAIVYALPPRETDVRYGGKTWELARLWIDDSVPANAETFLIARSVRYIRANHPDVRCLVSYADPSVGHAGVIYRAANWTPDGRTDDERKTPRFDYEGNAPEPVQLGFLSAAKAEKHYSRKGHVPDGSVTSRVARVSKHRFFLKLAEQTKPRQRPEADVVQPDLLTG